jgi:hypothetical protein
MRSETTCVWSASMTAQPVAMHSPGAEHETPSNGAQPLGGMTGSIVHALPSQRSISVSASP